MPLAAPLAAIESGLIRLKRLAAAARLQLAMRRHAFALKAGFDPNQPRVPAGDPDGGQLHNHPNAQVRLTSAIETLALEPIESRRVLQSISDRNEYPQAANARGMMMALDEGRYTPT
jgi:hypothetical protein